MDNLDILAKIMVSLRTILHGHGILVKIMARSWQGLQGTCHGSWQVYHGFEHWVYRDFEGDSFRFKPITNPFD